jgi:antitoxin (DNA-binding transcriptional repressor) of toxin-antitoxin stability system
MVITATELKANIGHYLNAVSEDDVFITKNGKVVARLSSPVQDKQAILDSLVGITSYNPVSLEEARKEQVRDSPPEKKKKKMVEYYDFAFLRGVKCNTIQMKS